MHPDTDRKIVEVYRTLYQPADSEDGTLADHSQLDCTPDEEDIEQGRKAPVDMAVHYLRDKLSISGPGAASGQVPNPRYTPGGGEPRCLWPGPGTWFVDESYHHPYRDEREETTTHLSGGWTDQEKRAVWARVTDNATPGDMSWVSAEMFDEKLREIIDRGPASSLLSCPAPTSCSASTTTTRSLRS